VADPSRDVHAELRRDIEHADDLVDLLNQMNERRQAFS
jgi:hypothetical protein